MSVQPTRLPSDDEAVRLREYLGVLRRRKWWIISITLVALAAAVLYAQRSTPIFEASSNVQATQTVLLNNGAAQGLSMQTESQAVTSEPVTKCAAVLMANSTFRADPSNPAIEVDKLCDAEILAKTALPPGLDRNVSVTNPPQSTVLRIAFDSPQKAVAHAGAQAFGLAYINYKVVQANLLLDQLSAPFEDQQSKLTKQLTDMNKKLDDAIEANSGDHISTAGTELVQNLTAQRNAVQQKLDNVTLSLLNLDPSHINPPQLLLPAKLPAKPISPNKLLDALLGFLVGLALGIVVAFLRERLDDSLRSRGDLEDNAGAAVLAVIPKVPGWKKKKETKVVTLEQRHGVVAEAYRKLRTSILFAAAQRQIRSIMVCSATAGEGKTTTAVNLALVLAEANKRVILLSADLRRPRAHRFFQLESKHGLSSVLAGEAKPWEVLLDPGVENLRIFPSGPVPTGPAELLQSDEMAELMAQLEERADFVIVDTAPLLLVSDALALAPLIDAILLVADAENTSRWAVRQAREQLDEVDAPVIGAVLNKFDPAKARTYPYYGYYYGYGYRYGRAYAYGEANGGNGTRRLLRDRQPAEGVDLDAGSPL